MVIAGDRKPVLFAMFRRQSLWDAGGAQPTVPRLELNARFGAVVSALWYFQTRCRCR